MARPINGASGAEARDSGRSKERILAAALKEFAAKGFAGARVDSIARRAAINKRMLYYYFGDKEGLFREVLRRRISERQAWAEASPDDVAENLPYLFERSCRDLDWIRLLEWEALQSADRGVIDEEKRRDAAGRAVARVRRRQSRNYLPRHLDPRHLLLGMVSLTMYPLAFPQLTRMITGHGTLDPEFRKGYDQFLRQIAMGFRPRKRASTPREKTAAPI